MSYRHIYVGGQWVAANGNTITVVSPHDGSVVGTSPGASIADVDRTVEAARLAFDSGPWPGTPVGERIAAVERIVELLGQRSDEMAELISSENGSPLLFSQLGQVGGLPDLIEGFIDAARSIVWEEELRGTFGHYTILREPTGVVAAISAFNIPQVIILGKLIPALLAGCTVIVKPSPQTPLDALLLAEVIHDVGLPPGVVSVIPGGPEVGRHLASHTGIDHVSFTGSSAVGREIGKVCGEQMKRMTLELGGKSAAIILDDADITSTTEALRFSSFINNGQACAAQTRVLAPRSRYAEVVASLAEAIGRFAVGDPLDIATEIGPVVSKRQQEKVFGYIRLGQAEGAVVVAGGDTPPEELEDGCYVRPTLFADATNQMRIAQEEIFGPVLTVIPYDGDDEAIDLANDSAYGLAGSVYTADRERAMAIARRVRTGTFGINRYGPDLTSPFGGYKGSGVGREYGLEGLNAFIEVKSVHG